jgi:hypothetical protein
MDPNTSNTGVPPPETDPGQTRYFSPQDVYRAQEAPPEVPQEVAQEVPQGSVMGNTYSQPPYQPYAETPVSLPAGPPPVTPSPAPSPPYSWPGAGRSDRDRNILALVLIGGGILFLLGPFNPFFDVGDMVVLLLGAILLYAYWNTRSGYRVGFLIPGAIMLGLGAGMVASEFSILGEGGADFTVLGLGLGFCLIWALERKHWWALIPGGILVLVGLSSISFLGSLWPLALIALGVYLLYEQGRRRSMR